VSQVLGRAVVVDGAGRDAGVVDLALAESVDAAVADDERSGDAALEVVVRAQPQVAGSALDGRVLPFWFAR
jgi:hypothetical protein